jgi:hypothetical protein
MFTIIGIIVITAIFGYIAFMCLMFALMTFGGFDEVNIPAGIVFTILLVVDCIGWWIIVGRHIHMSFGE